MALDFAKYPIDPNNTDFWNVWAFLDKSISKYMIGNLSEKTEIIPCMVSTALYSNYLSSTDRKYYSLFFEPTEQRYVMMEAQNVNCSPAIYMFLKNTSGSLSYIALYYQTAADNEGYPIFTYTATYDYEIVNNKEIFNRLFYNTAIYRKNGTYKLGYLGDLRNEFDIDLSELGNNQKLIEKNGLSSYTNDEELVKTNADYVFQLGLVFSNLNYNQSESCRLYYRANKTEYPMAIDLDYQRGLSNKEICGFYLPFQYGYNSTGYSATPIQPPTGHTYWYNKRCPFLVGSRVFKFETPPFGYSGEFLPIKLNHAYTRGVAYQIHEGKSQTSYSMSVVTVPYRGSNAPKIVAFLNHGKDWNGITVASGLYIFEDNRDTVFGEPCSYFYCPITNEQTDNKNYTTEYDFFYKNFFPGFGFSDYSLWTFTFNFVAENEDDVNPDYEPITYSFCGLTLQPNKVINDLNEKYTLGTSYTLFDNKYGDYKNEDFNHVQSYFGIADDVINQQCIFEEEKTV